MFRHPDGSWRTYPATKMGWEAKFAMVMGVIAIFVLLALGNSIG